MPKVTIDTTPTCPYCTMAKNYFKEKNINYAEIDVAADPKEAQAMIEKTGHLGVPVIIINDTIIIGFNKPAVDRTLGL
ncbi:MAG: NrdH-redoxin [Candidatus Buchananbacteria bacterium RIFCSPHIGHO2_01_FULL_39_14]|uniref:NrdH-redoxin n=2 Tax=Candidatus Buchananiibacteriota TaxID=1817903 RepID=A0A1G1YTD6_9BACT|nr:MAG: NrdH-redoxin [Candidatus Buchananbacteria bacterium RIFCSPHIGHO2_01_FULL_39_14]OGY49462.1 MAG: NrdH-redoxin [Candidatus Buchananbacteria bacterium RIFCSPHIGHO2_02_FULL_39_17]OGY55615.1 MAG: NrdH-redoxin [Candidatus Buchananbacteria bacterium RIFCSPLOWO2_01_FULL_40_23b]